jgi:Na+/melibiose symporter-like transporter
MFFSLKTIAYLCGILIFSTAVFNIGDSVYLFATEDWATASELLRWLVGPIAHLPVAVFFFVFAKRM